MSTLQVGDRVLAALCKGCGKAITVHVLPPDTPHRVVIEKGARFQAPCPYCQHVAWYEAEEVSNARVGYKQ